MSTVTSRVNGYYPGMGDTLQKLMRSQLHNQTFLDLQGQVPEQGKYKASHDPAASAAAKTVDALDTGETEFVRPNGEKYFSRKWGIHQDVAVVRKAKESRQHVYLKGSPGCGKTALLEAAEPDCYTVIGSGDTEVADFMGQFVPNPLYGEEHQPQYVWIDGPLLKAAEEGKGLLVDEIGLIDPKVLSVLYPAMDGRNEILIPQNPSRATVKIKDGFFVMGATNPNAPGVRLSEALLSRFSIQATVTTDWALAKSHFNVPHELVTAAQNLNGRLEARSVTWAPQMRELITFKKNADLYGEEFAIQNLLAQAPEFDRAAVIEVLGSKYGDMAVPSSI